MKQAIQEGFILDVLKSYTPIESYYKLIKTVEADPEFDAKRANKKLRHYVESHDHAVRLKAEIMVDHFHDHVLALHKIGGQARAMVVTGGIERAIQCGILETIDMDSYRVETQATMKVVLADEDVEIEPVPAAGGGHKAEPELDRLSNIIKAFNDQFGNIGWTDSDRVLRLITEEIPTKVAADRAYQNAMKNNDKATARIEHNNALKRVMTGVLKDDTELFKQFSDNDSFKRWLTDAVFAQTYEEGERPPKVGAA